MLTFRGDSGQVENFHSFKEPGVFIFVYRSELEELCELPTEFYERLVVAGNCGKNYLHGANN